MNKAQLIDAMAKDAEISKADAQKALEAFIKNTTESLQRQEKVTLVGFGSFSVSKRESRAGRDPRTGNIIQIPSKNIVKFKAGAKLSDSVQ